MIVQPERFGRTSSVVFDLDGTLIDSASSILTSLHYALKQLNIIPTVPLTYSLIGPPLHKIAKDILCENFTSSGEFLVEVFKDFYDSHGYKTAVPFPGVDRLLSGLKKKISLYILPLISAKRRQQKLFQH